MHIRPMIASKSALRISSINGMPKIRNSRILSVVGTVTEYRHDTGNRYNIYHSGSSGYFFLYLRKILPKIEVRNCTCALHVLNFWAIMRMRLKQNISHSLNFCMYLKSFISQQCSIGINNTNKLTNSHLEKTENM